jgi:hypothetical protein
MLYIAKEYAPITVDVNRNSMNVASKMHLYFFNYHIDPNSGQHPVIPLSMYGRRAGVCEVGEAGTGKKARRKTELSWGVARANRLSYDKKVSPSFAFCSCATTRGKRVRPGVRPRGCSGCAGGNMGLSEATISPLWVVRNF